MDKEERTLDFNNLFQEFDENEALLREVLQIFLEETPQKLSMLKTAYQNDDMETVAKIAHSLVNTAGAIHAKTLLAHCKKLEADIRQNRESDIKAQVDKILKESSPLFEDIKEILANELS